VDFRALLLNNPDNIEEALAEKIDRIEAKRGETFPQRTGEVRVGRPAKVRG